MRKRYRHYQGKFDIPTHLKSNYKKRVTDDPHVHRHTGKEIVRIVRNALNEIESVETLPIFGTSYIAEVKFVVRGGYTQPYYIPIVASTGPGCPYLATTIWTKELYEDMKKRQTDFRDKLQNSMNEEL